MIRPNRPDHPSLEDLVLFQACEFNADQVETVREHLDTCTDCRHRLEHLELGEQSLRNDASPLPGAHAVTAWHRLQPGLHAKSVAGRQWRVGIAIAAAGVLAIVMLIPMSAPPAVSAATVLEKAREAQANHKAKGATVYRKLRVRFGDQELTRASVQKPSQSAVHATVQASLLQALKAAHIDWDDPLDVNGFLAWRKMRSLEGGITDRVIESVSGIEVQTIPSRDPEVQTSSITLSKPTLLAQQREVHFSHFPSLEIVLLDFEIRQDRTPLPAARAMVSPRRIEERAADQRVNSAVLVDREAIEADTRLALFRVEAGLSGEEGEIRYQWSGNALIVQTFTHSSVRAQILENAIARIPAAVPRISTERHQPELNAGPAEESPLLHKYEPLLESAYVAWAGNRALASVNTARISDAVRDLGSTLHYLGELADRYPADRWNELPEAARVAVSTMVADLLQRVDRSLADISPLLLPFLQDKFDTRVAVPPAESGTCTAWQTFARDATVSSRGVDRSVGRMFRVVRSAYPDELSVSELLQRFNHDWRLLVAARSSICRAARQPLDSPQ